MNKILVIDRNINHQNFLANLLEKKYHVTTAGTACQVIDFIHHTKFDLIIGDLFVDEITWNRLNDKIYLTTGLMQSIKITIPTIFYCPSDITKAKPDIFQAVNITDGLIESSATIDQILSTVYYFLTQFKSSTQVDIELAKRKVLEEELFNIISILKNTLDIGKINAWEWNLSTNKVNDFGYSPSITRPNGYLIKGSMDWFLENLHPDDHELMLTKIYDSHNTPNDFNAEYRYNMNGKVEWLTSIGKVLKDQSNNNKKLAGIWKNINEQKNKEILIKQQSNALDKIKRLNSFGELTSTLSHELAQPLHIIKSYVTGCIMRLQEVDVDYQELLDAMNKVSSHVDLAGSILTNMKSFLRIGELNLENIDLNIVIRRSLLLLEEELAKSNIQLELNLPQEALVTKLDRIQIKQVIINIIKNSIDAINIEKTVNPIISISAYAKDNKTIEVSITDNGPGISDMFVENLFSPCFTTKTNGTGIGLKVAKTIIEAHGGKIDVDTQKKCGVSFIFTLPIIHEQ